MDLASILKAANHPETDVEGGAVGKQDQQVNEEMEKKAKEEVKEEEKATLYVATPIPTQAAIDQPMEASDMREALRLAREG